MDFNKGPREDACRVGLRGGRGGSAARSKIARVSMLCSLSRVHDCILSSLIYVPFLQLLVDSCCSF